MFFWLDLYGQIIAFILQLHSQHLAWWAAQNIAVLYYML